MDGQSHVSKMLQKIVLHGKLLDFRYGLKQLLKNLINHFYDFHRLIINKVFVLFLNKKDIFL